MSLLFGVDRIQEFNEQVDRDKHADDDNHVLHVTPLSLCREDQAAHPFAVLLLAALPFELGALTIREAVPLAPLSQLVALAVVPLHPSRPHQRQNRRQKHPARHDSPPVVQPVGPRL